MEKIESAFSNEKVEEMEDIVLECLGYEEAYKALACALGTWKLEQLLASIITDYDLNYEEEEEEEVQTCSNI